MYEEKKWKNIDWKGIGLKSIIVVLALLLLVWLVPKLIPDQNESNNKHSKNETKTQVVEKVPSSTFKENLETIKAAAKSYFTVDRLPEENGSVVTLTLEEMLEKKMILKFTDENGNFCNNQDSYAQMKKTSSNEYELKVQLTCNDNSDYIIENYGCYNVCTSEECNVEVKPITTCKLTCPTGYTLNGSDCYKNSKEKIEANKLYSDEKEKVEDAQINNKGSYKVYINPTITREANEYSCPKGYSKSGSGVNTKCFNTIYVNRLSTTDQVYQCPSGYTNKGSGASMSCTKISTVKASSKQTYTDGKAATKQTYTEKKASAKTTTKCPSGYPTRDGNRCYKTTNATKSTKYGNWYVYTTKKSTTPLVPYTKTTEKKVYTGMTSGSGALAYYNYTIYRRSSTTSYSCSSGTRHGSLCRHYKNVVTSTTYSCPSGTTSVGSGSSMKCRTYSTSYYCPTGTAIGSGSSMKCRTSTTTYYCPSGKSIGSGSSMTCQTTQTVKPNLLAGKTNYYCPTGYSGSSSGSSLTCYNVDYVNVIVKPGATNYTCPTDYTKKGTGANTKCYTTVKSEDEYYCKDANAILKDNKCYTTINSKFEGYKCPEGYNLDGANCYKPTTEKIKAKEVCNTDIPIEKDGVDVSKTNIGNMSTFDMIMYVFIILGTIIVSIEIMLYHNQRKEKLRYY